MRSAIAGATGLVGGHIVEFAGADTLALVRRPVPGLPCAQHVVDFERLEDGHLDHTLDRVYCALGTTIRKAGSPEAFRRVDYDYVLALGRWARAQGATEFRVVSSIGADAGSSNLYLRVKGEMERDLAQLGFRSLVIFQPGLLLGARTESRPLELAAQKLAPLFGALLVGPLKKYRPVEARDVARAMVRTPANMGVEIRRWPF